MKTASASLKMILMLSVFLFGFGSRVFILSQLQNDLPAKSAASAHSPQWHASSTSGSLLAFAQSKKRSRFDFDLIVKPAEFSYFNFTKNPSIYIDANSILHSKLGHGPKPRPC